MAFGAPVMVASQQDKARHDLVVVRGEAHIQELVLKMKNYFLMTCDGRQPALKHNGLNDEQYIFLCFFFSFLFSLKKSCVQIFGLLVMSAMFAVAAINLCTSCYIHHLHGFLGKRFCERRATCTKRENVFIPVSNVTILWRREAKQFRYLRAVVLTLFYFFSHGSCGSCNIKSLTSTKVDDFFLRKCFGLKIKFIVDMIWHYGKNRMYTEKCAL